MSISEYALHQLGWKAFQDLCIAIAEDRLKRPIQVFLPTNDAGRDGAFRGAWDGDLEGESTIQCKYTSKPDSALTPSQLNSELEKVSFLARRGLAKDYVILTNHTISGQSDLAIRDAFQKVGAGRCRVFGRDWILQQINSSPALRMMVPRLYGLADLTSLLDARAYAQARLILSQMGDNLRKLVVTAAHKKSVAAISEYNFVLLLGSPAAGKSTIGASLALGAADIWKCSTIKSTSAEHLGQHIDPEERQFFWIDDAWGSTQYQRDWTEAWNQVFPLMQGAMKRGTRFLITSRDYIWNAACRDLKVQALPVLAKSQVVVNVHELTEDEKARILYNHLKLGDQPASFRQSIKPILPEIAKSDSFLPESARRLGNRIFTEHLQFGPAGVRDFFKRPMEFLEQTISNLAPECCAVIALLFLNGGTVRSPVALELLDTPAHSFGVASGLVREQLQALNGSFVLLAEDEEGPYWTYTHPTISDAFASFISKRPELVELYLVGAKSDTIVREVVCAGVNVAGARLVIPNSLQGILLDRIKALPSGELANFISYRGNKAFAEKLLDLRPDLTDRLEYFSCPLKEDSDVDFLVRLHELNLLSSERRAQFAAVVAEYALEQADDSFLDSAAIASVLTDGEKEAILARVEDEVFGSIDKHIGRIQKDWDRDYDPDDYFDPLRDALKIFAQALAGRADHITLLGEAQYHIRSAIDDMEMHITPPSSDAPAQHSTIKEDSLSELFRDVDE
jgi:hypothetical protein